MGLFSRLSRSIRRITRDVGDIVEEIAPIAIPLLVGGFAGAALGGLVGGTGGAGAVAQANLAAPGCPPPGFSGPLSAGANPITRNALFPGFDPFQMPSRPQFGLEQIIAQRQQALTPPFFQGFSNLQQSQFGAPVGPTFRQFGPSFRSGRSQIPVQRGVDPGFLAPLPGTQGGIIARFGGGFPF